MDYTDSHFHLPISEVDDGFRGGIIASSRRDEWGAVLEACDAKCYFSCVGVHPWYVNDESEEALNALEGVLCEHPECGVGEIGLDGSAGRPAMDTQRIWFHRQLKLSAKMDRFAVLHIVRAWDDAEAIVREFPGMRIIVHGFHGTSNEVRRFMRFPKLYFSLGFDAGEPGKRFHAAIVSIPPERMLVESDAPFRGHASEEIPMLVEAIAKMKNLSPEYLSKQIIENWRTVVRG